MSSALILGEFKNQTTGATCTVIKLMPANGMAGNECYVTEDAEYLEPDSMDASQFKTLSGDILIAAD